MSHFYNRDLPYGEVGEKVVLDLIKLKYPKAHKITGNHSEYDIMIPETNKKKNMDIMFKRVSYT